MSRHTSRPKKLKLSKIFNLKPIATVATAILFLALVFLPISAPKPVLAHPGVFLSQLYGGSSTEVFYSVYADSDYVYAVGITGSEGQGSADALIVKFNKSDLSIASKKIYGGDSQDIFYSVYADSDYVYAVGSTMSEGKGGDDALIVKFNKSNLSIASKKIYGGDFQDYFYSVYADSDYVYAVGFTRSEGKGQSDVLIVKFNKSDLSIASKKIYGGSDPDDFRSVYADSDYIYTVGSTKSEGKGEYDALIVKFNKSNLSIASKKIYGGGSHDYFWSVYADSNYIYVVGLTMSEGKGGYDVLIVKFNKLDLTIASKKIYGGGSHDYFRSVYADSDYIYAVGSTDSEGQGSVDGLVIKFNKSDLSIASKKIYGGDNYDYFYSVYADSIYAVGSTDSEGQGGTDGLIVKFDISLPPGTYTSDPSGFTFQDSNLTLANSNLTLANSNLTLANSNLTLADSNLTLADSDLTLATYEGPGGEEAAVPEFTTITFIIAAVCGFGIYFVIRRAKEKAAK